MYSFNHFKPPIWQIGGHLQSIVPTFRRIKLVKPYVRERIFTPDDDFLDLDWIRQGSRNLLILTHGLEGNSARPYILGMAKIFSDNGWDVLAWNCRSCSGEMNRQLRLYNHGDIADLSAVIQHAEGVHGGYDSIVLVGFSMGGNISLKYAALSQHPSVKKVVAISAPLDMRSSVAILKKTSNWIYRQYFINHLMPKIEYKARQFPEHIDIQLVKKNKDWMSQAKVFFCTINGYQSLDDFYEKGSARHFLHLLKIPTLIVQAQNDPMLTPECSPHEYVRNWKNIQLETPRNGGHCGFLLRGDAEHSWVERRAWEWVENEK